LIVVPIGVLIGSPLVCLPLIMNGHNACARAFVHKDAQLVMRTGKKA